MAMIIGRANPYHDTNYTQPKSLTRAASNHPETKFYRATCNQTLWHIHINNATQRILISPQLSLSQHSFPSWPIIHPTGIYPSLPATASTPLILVTQDRYLTKRGALFLLVRRQAKNVCLPCPEWS